MRSQRQRKRIQPNDQLRQSYLAADKCALAHRDPAIARADGRRGERISIASFDASQLERAGQKPADCIDAPSKSHGGKWYAKRAWLRQVQCRRKKAEPVDTKQLHYH